MDNVRGDKRESESPSRGQRCPHARCGQGKVLAVLARLGASSCAWLWAAVRLTLPFAVRGGPSFARVMGAGMPSARAPRSGLCFMGRLLFGVLFGALPSLFLALYRGPARFASLCHRGNLAALCTQSHCEVSLRCNGSQIVRRFSSHLRAISVVSLVSIPL